MRLAGVRVRATVRFFSFIFSDLFVRLASCPQLVPVNLAPTVNDYSGFHDSGVVLLEF